MRRHADDSVAMRIDFAQDLVLKNIVILHNAEKGIDDGVSGDKDLFFSNTFRDELLPRARSRREMEVR
jgi:hypothetical protein